MQHLKTFESASAILGKDAKLLPLIDGIDQKHAKAIIAILNSSLHFHLKRMPDG